MKADASAERERMVRTQLRARGIRDERVLEAMGEVPREAFVPEPVAGSAYEDGPLPIGEGQTISQPYVVARMVEAAALTPESRVLEVGAGSGYAAAILGRVAGRVFAIERRAPLAEAARERLARLGHDNVRTLVGDGTRGLPGEAPFDAILVAAGGEGVPDALREQLKIGGRLVIPVGGGGGGARAGQTLTRIVRTGEDAWEEEALGGVRFVPLIGGGPAPEDRGLARLIGEAAEPLPEIDPEDDEERFAAAFDRFADARVVLLGESSHGTSDFYRARDAITRRLIERHGYTIVAVEADWPDARAVDRFVRGRPAKPGFTPFQRFPRWMWRNTDVLRLARWMRRRNERVPPERMAGFHGLDLYALSASIEAVLDYLDRTDPAAAAAARERYGCLTPYRNDPAAYGLEALGEGYRACEEAVVRQCRELLDARLAEDDDGDGFDAAQNARLVASAERYYRIMYRGGAESWNRRDTHMAETLEQLLDAGGPDAKAVVWAHNSHVGDARRTEMGAVREELNLGQLVRERVGSSALIGFGTHAGTVAAAHDWGDDVEIMRVRPSLEGSVERACHEASEATGAPRLLLDLREGRREAARRALLEPRPERFIGVIYRPDTERASHYADAALAGQFDAYAFLDETQAVTPLGPEHARGGTPETWPFGV